MKRMLMALAVAGIAASGSVRADPGGYAPPGGPQAGYQGPSTTGEFSAPGTLMGAMAPVPGKAPDRYGLLPGLRKVFRLGGSTCSTCDGKHMGHGGWGGSGGGVGGVGGGVGGGYYGNGGGASPPVMQGTLVFPHHPYVRSPRDYFMYEPGR